MTTDSRPSSPILTSHTLSNLTGIVSIVDSTSHSTLIVLSFSCGPPTLVLSVFARLAGVAGVDPTRMQRHRRASSTSSHSSISERDFFRSRSPSRASVPRKPSFAFPPALLSPTVSGDHLGARNPGARHSMSGLEAYQRAALSLKRDEL